MKRSGSVAGVCLLLGLAGCDQGEVVGGSMTIGIEPQEVRFDQPVTAIGPIRELCLEFDPPGDSHRAGKIRVVMITVEGRRDSFHVSSLDRKGEAVVCLISHGDDSRDGADHDAGGTDTVVQYRAVEFRAEVPIRVRSVRWHGRPAASSR